MKFTQNAVKPKNLRKHRKGVVCFVGISSKPGADGPLTPLSSDTLSGKIITEVEGRLRTASSCSTFLRDNLVQNPPLQNGKLRYPTSMELKAEWSAFERRLKKLNSNVVILLGRIVADFFKGQRRIRKVPCPSADGLLLKWAGVDASGALVLAVAHPSYVGIYARKRVRDYAELILQTVSTFLSQLEPQTFG